MRAKTNNFCNKFVKHFVINTHHAITPLFCAILVRDCCLLCILCCLHPFAVDLGCFWAKNWFLVARTNCSSSRFCTVIILLENACFNANKSKYVLLIHSEQVFQVFKVLINAESEKKKISKC